MKKSELLSLRAQIAQLASDGHAIRPQIHAAHGPARASLWDEKRTVGAQARLHLLAYAFLRNVPYRAVELNAVESQRPSARALAAIVSTFAASEASVRAWLDAPLVPRVPRVRRSIAPVASCEPVQVAL